MTLRAELRRQKRRLDRGRPPKPEAMEANDCGHWSFHAQRGRWVHSQMGIWDGAQSTYETDPCVTCPDAEEIELGEMGEVDE